MRHVKQIYLGYWNNDRNQYPEHPLPIVNSASDDEVKKQLLIMDFIQNNDKVIALYCKGFSICRCCSKQNGSMEYNFTFELNKVPTKIIIPDGLRHYIQDHKVLVPSLMETFSFVNITP